MMPDGKNPLFPSVQNSGNFTSTVLHNMLLYIGDEEREDWIKRNDTSCFDDESRVPPYHNHLLTLH
jgi:hypothetical protein